MISTAYRSFFDMTVTTLSQRKVENMYNNVDFLHTLRVL